MMTLRQVIKIARRNNSYFYNDTFVYQFTEQGYLACWNWWINRKGKKVKSFICTFAPYEENCFRLDEVESDDWSVVVDF